MPDDAAAEQPSRGDEAVFVALGSNLGSREAHLASARASIAGLAEVRVVAASRVEETAPIGPAGQPAYLNQMLALTTHASPLALLDALLEVERSRGRERRERWGARTLDCDVVRFGRRVIRHPRLTVPHPELPHRDFWRRELDELLAVPAVRELA
ncbi:MAG TPA: 2-amino-4-hydroxy-6-hydroxymethyldihydropteridine diphosphokinase [Gemmatimonadaceae bacterium]|nr:2-amino-4-hydroxy-6-hydroxymethyldihydropteridine diphosphokinase [Gemmatimonadaceae bacterium]